MLQYMSISSFSSIQWHCFFSACILVLFTSLRFPFPGEFSENFCHFPNAVCRRLPILYGTLLSWSLLQPRLLFWHLISFLLIVVPHPIWVWAIFFCFVFFRFPLENFESFVAPFCLEEKLCQSIYIFHMSWPVSMAVASVILNVQIRVCPVDLLLISCIWFKLVRMWFSFFYLGQSVIHLHTTINKLSDSYLLAFVVSFSVKPIIGLWYIDVFLCSFNEKDSIR